MRNCDAALLIDAGTGARRLVSDRELLDGVGCLHVVLTHFHLDHTAGLFYLANLCCPIEIWAAGEALEATPTHELLGRLLGSPFAPPGFRQKLGSIRELPVGTVSIGPFELRTRVQRKHSNATLALRVGDTLAWCTDTAYDEENGDFARGARILFHEAFYPGERTRDGSHTTSAEAARVAAAAGVERLVLVHVNPELDDEEALLEHARPHFAATDVGRDGRLRRVL